jgi:hypothetical protein
MELLLLITGDADPKEWRVYTSSVRAPTLGSKSTKGKFYARALTFIQGADNQSLRHAKSGHSEYTVSEANLAVIRRLIIQKTKICKPTNTSPDVTREIIINKPLG